MTKAKVASAPPPSYAHVSPQYEVELQTMYSPSTLDPSINNVGSGTQSNSMSSEKRSLSTPSNSLPPAASPISPLNSSAQSLLIPTTDKASPPVRRHLPHFEWWWETGSVAVSIVSTILIFAILFAMNNKPLAAWKLPIQPNSLVSVFSTIAKSALMVPIAQCISQAKWRHFSTPRSLNHLQVFDDASRDPWGSLMLFVRVKQTLYLAYGAAGLTLLVLAFEPFAQQVIQFEPGTTQSSQASWVYGISDWIYPDLIREGRRENCTFPASCPTADYIVRSALEADQGRDDNATVTTPWPYFRCGTSFCEILDVSLLSFCSSCEEKNITGLDDMECMFGTSPNSISDEDGGMEGFQELTLEAFHIAWKEDTHNGSTDTSLRSGCLSRSQKEYTSWRPQRDLKEGNICAATFPRAQYVSYIQYPDNSDDVKSVQDIQVDEFVAGDPLGMIQIGGWQAVFREPEDTGFGDCSSAVFTHKQCRLEMCEKHYASIVVEDGRLTTLERNATSSPLTILDNNDAEYITAEGKNITYQIHKGTFQLVQIALRDSHPFSVDVDVMRSSAAQLSAMVQTHRNGYEIQHVSDNGTRLEFETSSKQTTIHGIAYLEETYVRVKWAWLTLPVLILVGTSTLLILTIIQSQQMPYLYKSSALASLFHGLDGWDESDMRIGGDAVRGRETDGLLEKTARTMVVEFKETDKGRLKLVRRW